MATAATWFALMCCVLSQVAQTRAQGATIQVEANNSTVVLDGYNATGKHAAIQLMSTGPRSLLQHLHASCICKSIPPLVPPGLPLTAPMLKTLLDTRGKLAAVPALAHKVQTDQLTDVSLLQRRSRRHSSLLWTVHGV